MPDAEGLRQRAAGNAVATTGGQSNPANRTLVQLIDAMRPEIARALPKHMDPDRVARIATTLVRQTPQLLRSTPESFLGALMTCAQLGLEPGPLGHAYFVPFKNTRNGSTECQLIIGYRGLIDLARRSGHIESLVAREVYANDTFLVEYGLHEQLQHTPQLYGERGDVVAYYAVAKYVGGGYTFLVMTKPDVEKMKARSRAKESGPWQTDYDAMAKKTVIRQLAKWLPMSVEFAQAAAVDETVRVVQTPDDLDLPVQVELEEAEQEVASGDDTPADAEVVDPGTDEQEAGTEAAEHDNN